MRRYGFALLVPLTLVLLNCLGNSQTITVGQCHDYSWDQDCNFPTAPFCPSGGGVGNCTMVITDRSGAAIATQSHAAPSNYICVQPGSKVIWTEGNNGESFVVDFGSSTTPFTSNYVFAGNSVATPPSDTINSHAASVPECNEYVILHCGATSCTTGDPVVVVNGGHSFMKKWKREDKPHGEDDR